MRNVLIFLLSTVIFIVFFPGKPSESQLDGNPIIYENFIVALDVYCGYVFGKPGKQRIDAFDETTYDQVVSYIKRELRSFNDVDIAKEHGAPTHGIHIQTINRAFSNEEIIIVITFLEYIDRREYLAAYLPEKTVKKIYEKAMKEEGVWLIQHSLWQGTYTMHHNTKTGDLSKLCKQIIVDFDTKVLENARLKR